MAFKTKIILVYNYDEIDEDIGKAPKSEFGNHLRIAVGNAEESELLSEVVVGF